MRVDVLATEARKCFAAAQALLNERDVVAALKAFDAAQELGYSMPECSAGRWQCWMLLGRFERARQESDRIASSGVEDPHRFWDGASWAGRRVMLRCLHGMGDTIHFIRYASLLKQTCSKLIVQTHPPLVSLIANVPGVDLAVTWDSTYPEDRSTWDLQMEVNELPRVFRTALDSLPSACPYICIPPERLSWASQWFTASRRLRVGLVWQAGPWNPLRSMNLADLAPILSLAEIDFFSLQYGLDVNSLAALPQVSDVVRHSKDVLDSAALIAHLDLLITVDTMAAHLAGALGIPVWIMLPWAADWRWMLQTAASPWYPSAHLFRQDKLQTWSRPIQEIKDRLQNESLFCATRNDALEERLNGSGRSKPLTTASGRRLNAGRSLT